ncbi:Hypothetical predicted protein [Cloeon dipterum]|uniref:Uncharacterized protein n=1 Tax=Cloeon dipterum TaxID=197152 RepID=A0A8S1EEP2_9INSE|nr:Hypothetical predicted protein [Cloeon dipterum]
MSLQKELCLICDCPTADGAVLAVHVDKEKLQEWFLNVCENELADEIQAEDKICYFCIWHAEFQWKLDGMCDETMVWWNLDLDDAAKELRKHYFGKSFGMLFWWDEKPDICVVNRGECGAMLGAVGGDTVT